MNQAIDEVCVHLKGLVERHDDQNLYKGIMKFRERVLSQSSISQLSTGLHCFKSKYVWSKHLKKSQTVNLRKSRKGHIHVQPAAVKRKTANQSRTRQALPKGKISKLSFWLPDKSNMSKKRVHDLSSNIEK